MNLDGQRATVRYATTSEVVLDLDDGRTVVITGDHYDEYGTTVHVLDIDILGEEVA